MILLRFVAFQCLVEVALKVVTDVFVVGDRVREGGREESSYVGASCQFRYPS